MPTRATDVQKLMATKVAAKVPSSTVSVPMIVCDAVTIPAASRTGRCIIDAGQRAATQQTIANATHTDPELRSQ